MRVRPIYLKDGQMGKLNNFYVYLSIYLGNDMQDAPFNYTVRLVTLVW